MNKKVLVVDDRADSVNLISFALQKRGYAVITAGSGEEALEKLEKTNIDFVFLDVMMPGMSGGEVLSEIRKKKEYDSIKVIILTAVKFNKEQQQEFIKNGAQGFLTKPISIEELEASLKKLG